MLFITVFVWDETEEKVKPGHKNCNFYLILSFSTPVIDILLELTSW